MNNQTFETDNIESFQAMITHAIKEGLTFESGTTKTGYFTITYLGGY
jgi:hypothetical protein